MSAYFARHKELNLLNIESQKLFRQLVENIPVGAFMVDDVQKLFYVNHAFNSTFDLQNRTHALGLRWDEVIFVDPVQRKQFLEKLDHIGTVHEFETNRTTVDGSQLHFLISARRIFSETQEPIGIQGIIVDISLRKNLEKIATNERNKLEQVLSFYNGLSEISEINLLAKFIIDQTAEILEVKRCSLMFIDETEYELYIKAAIGIPDDIIASTRIKIGQPMAGLVVLEPKAMMIHNIEDNEFFQRPLQEQYSNGAFMSAPIVYNDHVIGVLNVSEKAERFSLLDLKILQNLAQQSSATIYKTMTYTQMQLLSEKDPLTGLYNFGSFNQKLDDEIARANRYNLPLCILMIDVDHFKSFNDVHGHPSGNALLKKLADLFNQNLRSTEHICRYGGDEFGIILPNIDSAQAVLVAEKLKQLVNAQFQADGISLSIGVSQFIQTESKESFIQHADQALYRAKKNGRNQIILWAHI